ncbi:hypothetical protein KUTeg_008080 [Tegillarca granosa]|uniref:Uncharacterized protein n=1 Tax=Tegillarca granosa TaxID=220873 RepID=A0ABQ9F832_TEGGR|nr:hypothetical protein KUTeg_008080 [Tegillarca granosa]
MDPLQTGVVLSREKDVIAHGYVLYGLVKPAKDGGVQSAAGMANVIPRKRIYRMETIAELECFRDELMKRPLVLQPSVQAGSGIQKINCFFNVKKENWVMMINQNHPKIMGRIMMGIDAAKTEMKKGVPFILEYTFSDILRKLYFDIVGRPNTRFDKLVYMDCDHADMIVHYAGAFFNQGLTSSFKSKTGHIKFSFDDIVLPEVKLRTLNEAAAQRPSPIIQIVPEYKLTQILPGWQFQEAEVVVDEEEEEQEEEGAVGYQGIEISENSYVQYDDTKDSIEPPVNQKPGRIKGRANRNKASNRYEVPVELHVPKDPSPAVYNPNDDPPSYNKLKFSSEQTAQRYQNRNVPYGSTSKYNDDDDEDDSGFIRKLNEVNTGMQNVNLTSTTGNRYEQLNYNHKPSQDFKRQIEHPHEAYQCSPRESDFRHENQYHDKMYSPGNHGYHHVHQGSGSFGSSAADSGYDGENTDNGGFENAKHGRFHHHDDGQAYKYNNYHDNIHKDLNEHRQGSWKPYDNPAYKHDHSPKDPNKSMAAQVLQYQNYNHQPRSPRQLYDYNEREMEDKYSNRQYDTNSSSRGLQWTGLQKEERIL